MLEGGGWYMVYDLLTLPEDMFGGISTYTMWFIKDWQGMWTRCNEQEVWWPMSQFAMRQLAVRSEWCMCCIIRTKNQDGWPYRTDTWEPMADQDGARSASSDQWPRWPTIMLWHLEATGPMGDAQIVDKMSRYQTILWHILSSFSNN